jgi:hypothetical protein
LPADKWAFHDQGAVDVADLFPSTECAEVRELRIERIPRVSDDLKQPLRSPFAERKDAELISSMIARTLDLVDA